MATAVKRPALYLPALALPGSREKVGGEGRRPHHGRGAVRRDDQIRADHLAVERQRHARPLDVDRGDRSVEAELGAVPLRHGQQRRRRTACDQTRPTS